MNVLGIEVAEEEVVDFVRCFGIYEPSRRPNEDKIRERFKEFIARLRLSNFAVQLAEGGISDDEFERQIKAFQPFPGEVV